jgi:RimJ/RimL family protein N-acetyltransferase
MEYAFNVMKFHKIASHTFARNYASGRVLEKLGLKREGHLRSHIKHGGKREDIIEYGILEDEFRQLVSDLQRSG